MGLKAVIELDAAAVGGREPRRRGYETRPYRRVQPAKTVNLLPSDRSSLDDLLAAEFPVPVLACL